MLTTDRPTASVGLGASRRWAAVLPLTFVLSILVAPMIALAQDQALGGSTPATPAQLLADRLVTLTRRVLNAPQQDQQQVRPSQLAQARILLDMALKLDDADPALWRLRAELAQVTQDQDALGDALRRYLQLRPSDDVAQLSFITMSLAQAQTNDARLTSLERILDSRAGQRFSEPLRSRLATLAAAAAAELGDPQRRLRWLGAAATGDSANITAALMTLEVVRAGDADPFAVGQALLNVMRSAPLDDAVRRAAAEHLLSQAAYADAAGQFGIANQVAGARMDESFYHGWAAAMIGSGRTGDALTLLQQLDQLAAAEAAAATAAPGTAAPTTAASGTAAPAATPPKPIKPTWARAWLRVVALIAPENLTKNDNPEAAAAAVKDAVQALQDLPATKADAHFQAAVTLLLFGGDTEQALRHVQAFTTGRPAADPQSALLGGLVAYRGGQKDRALELLTPIGNTEPLAAYLLAVMGDLSERPRQQVLQRIVWSGPASLPGLLASATLRRAGSAPAPTPAGDRLAAQLASWSGTLRAPDAKVAPIATLRVDPIASRYAYLQPLTIALTLRNNTEHPLALGSTLNAADPSAIPGRVLLLIEPHSAGDADLPAPPPQVVDLGLQLRLNSRQSLRLEHRLDRSAFGTLLDHSPTRSISFRVTAVLDPRPTAQGGLTPGPLGVVTTSPLIEVWALPATEANLKLWLADLDSDDALARLTAMARLVQAVPEVRNDPALAPLVQQTADRLSQNFNQLDATSQAWLAYFAPDTDAAKAAFPRLHEQAGLSEDPTVRIMYLASRPHTADAPAIAAAMRSRTPAIADFAAAMHQSLKAPADAQK
jgi:hypothetical protein